MAPLIAGYCLRAGSSLDRALLVKFMQRTYQELYGSSTDHLAQTVDFYLSSETPLWWVEPESTDAEGKRSPPIGCLWVGSAIDQSQGDRHAHIFLLYVHPDHRRRGIGTALMHQAETWARQRGDRQIGLQVFCSNQPAVNLYTQLGFTPQSIWMVKSLS